VAIPSFTEGKPTVPSTCYSLLRCLWFLHNSVPNPLYVTLGVLISALQDVRNAVFLKVRQVWNILLSHPRRHCVKIIYATLPHFCGPYLWYKLAFLHLTNFKTHLITLGKLQGLTSPWVHCTASERNLHCEVQSYVCAMEQGLIQLRTRTTGVHCVCVCVCLLHTCWSVKLATTCSISLLVQTVRDV
jgi:hypothetical protein